MAEEAHKPHVFLVERRRNERRLLVNVPVEIAVETGEGSGSTDRTFIEDVSDFGCRFTTRLSARKGDRVSLKFVGPAGKNPAHEDTRHYEIMWVAPQGRGFTMGARLVQGEKPIAVDLLPGASEQAHRPK